MNHLRAVIADDESLARDLLRSMLASHADVEVVAEARNGREAVAALERHRPDVIFLDVQMPELDGIDVVESIGPGELPTIVFVTAYDRYAVRAFEAGAVDYLLKPFDTTGLDRALSRVRERRARADGVQSARELAELARRLREAPRVPGRLPVKEDGRVRFVELAAIDWIDVDDKHVRIHAGAETIEIRETLQSIEERVGGALIRVHRGALVNPQRVREVQPWFGGDFVLLMQNGDKVTSGRGYRGAVRRLIGER